jgi:drug/metabolite transporter (DMT)-like permease
MVCVSSLFFSVMGLCLKQLRTELGAMEVSFFRFVASVVLTLAACRFDVARVAGKRPRTLILRGLAGTAALVCYVHALGEIGYAQAAALLYTSPVFTALFAARFLREPMPPAGWLALGVCLLGSLLVLDPSAGATSFHWLEGAIALGSGVLSGIAYVSVRACARTETNAAIVFWFATIGAGVTGVLMLPEFRWPTAEQWLWIAAAGTTAQLGQVYLTRGLRAEAAGTAMLGAFVVLALAALWGFLFFGERPTAGVVAGALLIAASILLTSRRRRNRRLAGRSLG